MRALLPPGWQPRDSVSVQEAYAPPPRADGALFVRCNMISTLDGVVTLGGTSGALGGPADRRVFQVLRSWADVIVVGAGTARAERYGPARLDEALSADRLARGQAALPRIAVVTSSGSVDAGWALFTGAAARPVVVTSRAGERAVRRNARLTDVADVLVADGGEGAGGADRGVDLVSAFEQLAATSGGSLLVEGGPALNAGVVRAGLLDELCLTVSPRLVAGDGPRVVGGPAFDPPLGMELLGLWEEDGFLFLRLAVA